jgi:hypothetical protein
MTIMLLGWLLPVTVKADKTYKLVKVTNVKAGGLYVFEQKKHVINNSVSSGDLQTTGINVTDNLQGDETYVWTLESATGGFYMKNVSNGSSGYLNVNGSTSTKLSFVNNSNKKSIWKFTFENETALVQDIKNNDRFLAYIAPQDYQYRAYAVTSTSLTNTNTPHAIVVYELMECYTASFIINGSDPSEAQCIVGTNVTFPAPPDDVEGKSFVGWSTSEIVGKTDEQPEDLLLETTMPSHDITFYAVFGNVVGETVTNYCTTITENHPVTITSSAKYATYSATQASDFSGTGVTVFTARVSSDRVLLSEVADDIVPANVGVVLYKDVAVDETVTVPSRSAVLPPIEGNELLVSNGTVTGDGSTLFALANKNQGVGFYRVKNGTTIPAGRPYLVISNSDAREFLGFDEEPDGITCAEEDDGQDFRYFNLSGQSFTTPPAPGLYVVRPVKGGLQGTNGKKVLIK